MSCNCKCENIQFGCGITTPEYSIGKCIYPESFSLDFQLRSRFDCIWYDIACVPNNQITGIIDCYDRQALIDNTINGTYILNRWGPGVDQGIEDPSLFSYLYAGPSNPIDIHYDCGIVASYDGVIRFHMTAARCGQPHSINDNNYDVNAGSCGSTGVLVAVIPLRYLYPSTFPRVPGSTYNLSNFTFPNVTVTYISNQPIACDGPVTFTLQGGPNDHTGIGTLYTIYPSTITVTPITP